jgi:hypothetical protein
MPNADKVLALLGQYSQDPAVEQLFIELETRRRPELDPADRDNYNDFVLIRRKGIELGFVDAVFFRAGPPDGRRGKGVGLLMHQAYFYNDAGDISRFSGKLPFDLEWSDNRESARRKLAAFESVRRSYIKDCWKLPQFHLTLQYKDGNGALLSILCQLPLEPWPEDGRIQPAVRAPAWLSMFGLTVTSPGLIEALQPLNLAEIIKHCDDTHEIDLRFECGVQIVFTKLANLHIKDKAALTPGTALVLGAVTFLRSRHIDAREWMGGLPFDLTFEDTPLTIANKVGRPPDKRNDDDIAGFAFWRLGEFDLHIQYSIVENHLTEVTMMAPGFWK